MYVQREFPNIGLFAICICSENAFFFLVTDTQTFIPNLVIRKCNYFDYFDVAKAEAALLFNLTNQAPRTYLCMKNRELPKHRDGALAKQKSKHEQQ